MLTEATMEQFAQLIKKDPKKAGGISHIRLSQESLSDSDAVERMTRQLATLLALDIAAKFVTPVNEWAPHKGCIISGFGTDETFLTIARSAIAQADRVINEGSRRFERRILFDRTSGASVDEFIHHHIRALIDAGHLGPETYTALSTGRKPTEDKSCLEHYVTMDALMGYAGTYRPRTVLVAEAPLPTPEEDLTWAIGVFALRGETYRRHPRATRPLHDPVYPVILTNNPGSDAERFGVNFASALHVTTERRTSRRTGEEFLSWQQDQTATEYFAETGIRPPWTIPLE